MGGTWNPNDPRVDGKSRSCFLEGETQNWKVPDRFDEF